MSGINHIQIKGFKSIKALDLDLTQLNILIGANGAGKSNFISFFKLLNNMIEENLQSYVTKAGKANKLLHFGRKQTSFIEGALTFDRNHYLFRLEPTNDDSLFFAHEEPQFDTDTGKLSSDFVRSGHEESYLSQFKKNPPQEKTISYYVLSNIKDWKIYHFHDTSESAAVKSSCNIHDNDILKPDASNLAAFLYYLQQTETAYYDKIVRSIQLVAPFFKGFNLRPDKDNPEIIRLKWKEKGSEDYFDANDLSDGTLRYICLATLLLQPDLPSTILIDEPELGLHPYAISVLASLIQSASTRTQLIISTQSVQLINQFEPKDIIVTDKIDGESLFKRLNTDEIAVWREDYTLGEIWEKNLFGGRPQA